jgi:preprotein translocase subunit Sss1
MAEAKLIPPAIAAISDVHGWILRGLIEAGLQDGTGRNRASIEAGLLDASDLLGVARGAEGIRLGFLCPTSIDPNPEDEFIYVIKVSRQPDRAFVVVRCAESIFYQEVEEAPYESLGGRILAMIRAHNARFTAWRQRGGMASMAERKSVPDVRGMPASAPLSNFMERHYKSGGSLSDGPQYGWWNERFSARELGKQIGAGQGGERYIQERKLTEAEKPENIAYIKQLKIAAIGMMAYGGAGISWCMGIVTYMFYRWVTIHFGAMFSEGWPQASLILMGIMSCLQLWGGWQLYNLRSAFWVQGIALLGALPCGFSPCCLMGIPTGALVFYRMRDPKMELLFES